MGWTSSSSVNNDSGTTASRGGGLTLEVGGGGTAGGFRGDFRREAPDVREALKGSRLWKRQTVERHGGRGSLQPDCPRG